jgi:hypothetical protein
MNALNFTRAPNVGSEWLKGGKNHLVQNNGVDVPTALKLELRKAARNEWLFITKIPKSINSGLLWQLRKAGAFGVVLNL